MIGLYDLIGVSWLRRRTRVPEIVEDVPEGRHISDLGRRLKFRSDGLVRKTGDKS